jgi:hypothetical protein
MLGSADASEDGSTLELTEGTELGMIDGVTDGFPLGTADGSEDGSTVGFTEGTELGMIDGVTDGSKDGIELGDPLGFPDGLNVLKLKLYE